MTKLNAKRVVNTANKYVGYLEKESNKDLDSMTANAGDKNFTIFAKKYKGLTGIDNQGSSWCDMFVDCCFAEAYGKENAKKLLGGFSASTQSSAMNFRNMKRWYTKSPKIGDIIFFKNAERIYHTGIVYNVTKTRVYTIEGNTSEGEEIIANGGAVCKKSYLLSNPRIAGYGRPIYERM